MPPPPAPPPPPQAILEPEAKELSVCLKNAVVKTGQIYGFYADTRRLGIQRYAQHPPRSMVSALGREIERYDALMDTIESQLLHSIALLRRELQIEQDKAKAAEEAVASHTRSRTASLSPATTRASLPPVSGTDPPTSDGQDSILGLPLTDEPSSAAPSRNSQSTPPAATPSATARRMSTISLSSLNRPSFPHKLDLSSASLALTPSDAALFATGLASPVTLAPRSARPSAANELPPDLLAMALAQTSPNGGREVDIDLTMDDSSPPNALGAIGSSADKPIELDLELDMDLFGDGADDGSGGGLFSPSGGVPTGLPNAGDGQSNPGAGQPGTSDGVLGLDVLDSFTSSAAPSDSELFQSLAGGDPASAQGSQPGQQQPQQPAQHLDVPGSSDAHGAAPSPGAILASFAAANPQAQDGSTTHPDGNFNFASLGLDQFNDSSFFSSETDTQGEGGGTEDMASLQEMLDFTSHETAS
ncbi:hypothetical protein PUNSTDRAFT_123359 [Punctularia strigosozonata HHB-11173 SS5]|uniref:uncharacterized protein n=1 Tax=Punctularia strigosozonata (strain HHB-11173) TaxID=741275 RepID=UPI00044173FB|nr:uncharacterized protein PUNSTDRAFT_123359 [Punctularia strigosozonata HHB-11173 SS5]EIN13208.1 hypothetical protein PUNSTDRAFT_123359 [Punctularia strigosozonata HHB-11173 SS5]